MGRSLRLLLPACPPVSPERLFFASLGISASSAASPSQNFTAEPRRMLHYYATCAAVPLFLQQRAPCCSHEHPEWMCSRCPAGHSQAAALFTACTIPPSLSCRWCCALTACSGIPASTCSVTSAPPQRVGVNFSSSGTSTKVTKRSLF